MTRPSLALALVTATLFGASPVFADADPTVQQIYDATKAGQLAKAQEMIEQVLRDHPQSAKAHYVAAEVYSREGKSTAARGELQRAEQIDPSNAFAKPEALRELKAALGVGAAHSAVFAPTAVEPAARHGFTFLPILILVGAIALLWMLFRRRSVPAQYSGQIPGAMPLGGTPGPYGGPAGYGGPGAPMGGGIGSSIVGGLASGLAVGAGVVAGEELAHHFLDGERREGPAPVPTATQADDEYSGNADLGGNDFGVNEPDSWDDSGSGGGGGDDWT